MRNELTHLINQVMDLSIEDSRKADIVEAMMLIGGDKDCLFKSFAQDYVKDMQGDLSHDYIECGGLLWARENIETDDTKYHTFDEASERGAPTKEELEAFIGRTYYGFDKIRKVGIFVDRETGVKLELPANGWRDRDGKIHEAGAGGCYWLATRHISFTGYAYYLHFNSNGVKVPHDGEALRFSIRNILR